MGLKAAFCAALLALSAANAVGADGGAVTIYRDDWGVPHIYADDEALGYYGLGYAEAEDRLLTVLGSIYWMQGRQAELTGAAALQTDIEQRRWHHYDEAVKGLANLSPQLRRNYESFVAGFERYLSDHPEKKPAWAPKLTAAHFVGLSRAVFWAGYAGIEGPRECSRTIAGLEAANATPNPGASNGWAVAPARSALGATMLLADPHLEFQSPAYYEYRMHAGNLHSAGFALGPLLWQANTRDVGWAMTTGNPDMWDCYAVTVDAKRPSHYVFDGTDREIVTDVESFAVQGGATVTRELESTRHNGVVSPVVARRNDVAYVVSASQMHDAGLLDEEIYRMNRATSIADVRDAMQSLGMFPQNLVIADRSGNLFYVRAGKTPRRPAGYDWTRAVPGNTSQTSWHGYHPFADLVQTYNPVQGYLQNSNVAPDRMFQHLNLNAADYPSYLFNDTPGRETSRGIRVTDFLASHPQMSAADAFELAVDETWITTQAWQQALRFALRERPQFLANGTATLHTFVGRLLDFDGIAAADSVAALDFYYWRSGMWSVFSQPQFAALRRFPWDERLFSEAFAEAMLEQTNRAVADMQRELGSIDVPLGRVFRIGRGDRSWPLGGETIDMTEVPDCLAAVSPLCERTVRAFASGAPNASGERRAARGSTAMRLVFFTTPIEGYSLRVYGQSDDPTSPHFDDQARLSSERLMKPMYFEKEQLLNHIESTRVLAVTPAEPSGD